MDKDLLQTIIIAASVLVLGIPTLRLVRLGRVSGLSAGRDGIKLYMTPLDRRDEARYYMDRRIADIDSALKIEARDLTQGLRKPILRAVATAGLCTPALRAVVAGTATDDDKSKLAKIEGEAGRLRARLEELRAEEKDSIEAQEEPVKG
jgi:hypothetical protein